MLFILLFVTVAIGVAVKRLGVSNSMQGLGKMVLLTSIYLVFVYKVVIGLVTRRFH